MERKPFFKVEERALTPKIMDGFYSKSNLTTFYDYIPVYKISTQYTNPFKRYRMETKSVMYATGQTAVCLCWGFTAQSTQWGHVERGQFT